MTKTPSIADLNQLSDWLRRAVYEIAGGPMQGIETEAVVERLPNGRVRLVVSAEYDPS